MLDQILKVKDKVGILLEKYPETRDSDKVLWLAYCWEYTPLRELFTYEGYSEFSQVVKAKEIPTFESLTRVRRKYQENGKYLGKRRKQKMQNADDMKRWAVG